MTSLTQAIAMLRKPLSEKEAEELMSQRISFLKSQEAERERNRLREIAGRPRLSTFIATELWRKE